MGEFLQGLFESTASANPWQEVASRLTQSLVLGLVVSMLYAQSIRRRDGAPGLGSTLVLLTMLITMVTISVKGTPEAAFALFGTLAIVRFRTRVRDIRDTGFVLYAVVVGLSVGALNPQVALVGTTMVGIVTFVISALNNSPDGSKPTPSMARLTIRTSEMDFDANSLKAVLGTFTTTQTLVGTRTNRSGKALHLTYDVRLRNINDAPSLIQALTASPTIQRAGLDLAD